MYKVSLFFLFFLCQSLYFSQSIQGFNIPDSLKEKNYDQLQKAYSKVFRINNNLAELYANAILLKGKKEKNNELIYDGYYKIAHTRGLNSTNGLPYADTLLTITSNVSTKDYPAKAHIIKGILLNYEFKYSEALDHYIQAQNLSKNKNPDQFFYIKKLIGILKTATDENKEALPLFLEYYNYQKQKLNTNDKDIKSYIGSIASISGSYNKNANYNKSKFYNKLGLRECKKYNDYTHYIYFIMLEGVADYYLKNYSKSLNNLLETEKVLIKNEDFKNLSIVYYCLGKINYETNKEKEAINFFLKSDSLSFIADDFLPKTRDRYEILIDYYKKKGDKENQLKFIDKLFYADSIMNTSRQYLSKEIYKKYDTPILLEKKEDLINDLNNKNSLLYWCLAVGFVTLSILLFMFIKNKKKVQAYQKQAELLLRNSIKSNEILPQLIVSKDEKINEDEFAPKKPKATVPNNILLEIKSQLELFEANKEFLQKNITVDSLAKDLGTNRDYLSKSVNELKEKNFSQYLNELRINYIVEELKTNKFLRKHTISAIAEDIGFNNSESFSNAFKKITGTLPSYYIKLLQSQ